MSQKLLFAGHCCAARLVLNWMRISSICSVLFLGWLTWARHRPGLDRGGSRQLGPAGRHVDRTGRRHNVGFIRGLMKAESVGFVERAVEHVGSFFVAKKAGA